MKGGCVFALLIFISLGKFEYISPTTRCFQEPGVVGDCSDHKPTWTYVPMFGCYTFHYSGCGGNANNFYSKKECQENCGQIKGSSLEMDPIPNNGQETFPIDKARRTNCKYEHGSFIIKKKKTTKYFWIFEGDHNSGSIKCFIGYISQVTVELPARQCGLGTIFTTLCMVDEDMNGPNGNVKGDLAESNRALDKLEDYPKELKWVKDKCKNFWSLQFVADLSAANTYFNAALDSGFTLMLLEDSEFIDGIYGPDETKHWKENYDPKTGLILKSIKVLNAYWFFCQPY